MQFITAGKRLGERALYITLEESKSELEGSARSHGWSTEELPTAEFLPAEATLTPEQQYTVFHPSEVELAGTIHKLTQLIDELKPHRVVIDSLSELRLLAADTMRYRRQLLAFKHFFAGRETTVLLLDDRTAEGSDMQLQSMAHGVVRLEKVQRSYGVTRRHVEIMKFRGSAFREGRHDYTIDRGGTKDTRAIVIDSLNGYLMAMPAERDLNLHLHKLLSYLNQQGVVTILIYAQHGLVGSMQTEVNVSYVFNTAVLLRYFEAEGEIRYGISVIKQRVGAHERTLRELRRSSKGVEIGETTQELPRRLRRRLCDAFFSRSTPPKGLMEQAWGCGSHRESSRNIMAG